MSRLLLNRPLLWARNPTRFVRHASNSVNKTVENKPIVLLELFPEYTNLVKAEEFKKKREDLIHHSEGLMHMWRKFSFYVGLPIVFVTCVYVYRIEVEHLAHLRAHPIKYLDYDHLHIRNKPLPYGDGYHTLFSNPLVNPDPPAEEE